MSAFAPVMGAERTFRWAPGSASTAVAGLAASSSICPSASS